MHFNTIQRKSILKKNAFYEKSVSFRILKVKVNFIKINQDQWIQIRNT